MTSYVLNENKMYADIADGIVIIINSETGVYYGMNKLGTSVYQNLINGASVEDIISKLKVWNANIEDSLNAYIKFLLEKEILLPALDTTSVKDVVIDESIAKEDLYIPTVAEYKDAQELLLADPIHEVKEDEGWSPDKSSLNEDKEDVARREAKMGMQ